MIEFFRQWFELRRSELTRDGISLDLSPATEELYTNSIHADLRSTRYEWTAQLWENGLSDFHFLDWDNMDKGIETVHYEIKNRDELASLLEETLKRMYSDVTT